MEPTRRLFILMLLGALIGLFVVSPELLESYNGYDHGFGESQRWNLVGTIIGALGGLLVEVIVRWATRPSLRFTMKEMFLTMTLFGIIIAVVIRLLQWSSSFSFRY